MATLNSPGSLVSVVNQSFYTPAAPGTVPMIFVATQNNKTSASGTGLAVGTDPANVGVVYNISSQQDLVNTFGTPLFYTDASGNPIHGDEQNEYGLQAAYSFLGVSSQAYVVRSDVDLGSLTPQGSEPEGPPADGTLWLNTALSTWGIFQWDGVKGQFGSAISPIVIDDSNYAGKLATDGQTPLTVVGTLGQYAIVSVKGKDTTYWFKNSDGNWVELGSQGETFPTGAVSTFSATTWKTSWPTVSGTAANPTLPTGTIVINSSTVSVTSGETVATLAGSINQALGAAGVGAKALSGRLYLYADANAASAGGTAYDGNILISDTNGVAAALGITTGTLYHSPAITIAPHTQYPQYTGYPTGSIYIKTTTPNVGANLVLEKYSAASNSFVSVSAPIYPNDRTALFNLDATTGGLAIPAGSFYVESNPNDGTGANDKPLLADLKFHMFAPTGGVTKATGSATTATVSTGTILVFKETVPGSASFGPVTTATISGTNTSAIVSAINNSGLLYTQAQINTDGTVSIIHKNAGDVKILDASNVLGTLGFSSATTKSFYAAPLYDVDGYTSVISSWAPATFVNQPTEPTSSPTNGTIWYDSSVTGVDLLWNNGTSWIGYGNAFAGTDPNGPIVAASKPLTQSDGVTALATGDVWVDSSNLELYGTNVYVFSTATSTFVKQDMADSTSPSGWVFADARYATDGSLSGPSTISDLRSSNYVDPDCPDPALYPRGTTLWNTRRSGFNVKKYESNYIDITANGGVNIRTGGSMTNYLTARWVTISPNQPNGIGSFGRKAQRSVVVKSLKSLVNSNQNIRDTDTLVFNLVAAPGYPELIQDMVEFNTDRGLTAFVVGDSPLRLTSDATSLQNWGQNSAAAPDNGDSGLVTFDEQLAVFYPSGYTSDNAGNNIVVPASHAMLTTIALSDQKSYPWFAPAGTTRGVVSNISSAGYLNAQTGEFVPAALPTSIRDTLASVKVNPITTFVNGGIVNFGNYTRAHVASDLDRINVSRLVCYLRYQLDVIARPYIFEPNDATTRAEIKSSFDSFLLELMGQRAIYDYVVVCDTTNNTPDRIDRSELWIDVAIEPTKAAEFIYIPLRLLNTGAIAALK